ncbi:hypothetical protein H0H93_002343 [Arthromyces matolae]|nr:hypothetical protein H0H93_002343 [Arthromyces matolae]
MAVLRDALRLGVFEPLAHWKLTRDLYKRKELEAKKSNGHANGHAITNGVANGNGNGHAAATVTPPTPKELRKVHRSVLRFAEQGWSVVYYTLQWSYGLYIHHNLPTELLEPSALWKDYPHIPLAGPLKFYYLTQAAFYLHQVLILNAEERRKDHYQMMTHHVITIFLVATSYFMNFTRVGCVIMVLMDCCDIFLPVVGKNDTDTARLIVPFTWSAEDGRFFSHSARMVFVVLLCALQALQIVWFGMICRVAWRVLTTASGASDVRSEDESALQVDSQTPLQSLAGY